MQEPNLFEAEDKLAEDCRALLDAGAEHMDCTPALGRLLTGYERLLRETKQLIRLSDRREKDLNRLNKKLEQLTHSLAYKAEHDSLTGCLNKGAMMARIESALSVRDFGLVLIDIDHFKRVNDVHGHPAGDSVLRQLADLMQENLGADDLLGRLGGEEFAILLPQPTLIHARSYAESLRRKVEVTSFDIREGSLAITISLGVTVAQCGERGADVYARADEALYAAKAAGRNRVAFLESEK